MKIELKQYLGFLICVALVLSIVNINIDEAESQPSGITGSVSFSGTIFEDIGTDTYKNGLNADTDGDDWDRWNNPGGTEDNGALDGGEGLTGVDVYLDDRPTPIATTGVGGTWSAPGMSTFAGKHYLTFKKDGYVTKTRNIDVYSSPVDLNATALERADAIIGRVTDSSGNPITGARVVAYPRNPPNWALTQAVHDAFAPGPDGQHIIEGFTDKFGNYVLKGLPKGNYDIRVTKEEYASKFKTIYGVNTDLGPKTLNFTLTLNPGTLEGVVHDSGGNPIANATVSIPGLNLSTTTDPTGYYEIPQIPAGMYTVVAKAQGYKTEVYYYNDANNPAGGDPTGNFNPSNAYTHPMWGGYAPYIGAGQTISNFDFEMDTATQECENDISGIVSNGAPIEYAQVEIPGLNREITTDKAGYYIFTDVPCGTYWVVASDPEPDSTGLLDHKSKKALVECAIGQEITQDFVLEENPCTIFGRVLQYDTDWVPVANATVEIPHAGISTTTDSFGYYVIEDLPVKRWSWWDEQEGFAYKTKEYLVKVSKSGYHSTTEYVKPIPQQNVWQEFHIKKKTGILKGKVTEWDTDQGIGDIKVTCAGRETYTDGNGFYEFVEVPIGSYTVHAEDYTGGGGWPPANSYDNKAKINQEVTTDNVTITDFRLPDHASGKTTGSVSGHIWYDWNKSAGFSNEGEGVEDAEVLISGKHSVDTDSYGYYVSIASSQDMYGQYDTLVVKQGAPGHVVTADASGYHIGHSNTQAYTDIDITDLSLTMPLPPTPLNIELNKLTGDLKGTVYDKDKNKPLPGHIVHVPLAGAPSGYVAFYDGSPTSYDTAWPKSFTDTLGTYFISAYGPYYPKGIPKGDHVVWEHAPSLMPNYQDMFERVDIQSLINQNFGATRKIGRIEGRVWDEGADMLLDKNFDPNENPVFSSKEDAAVVKLSGKSTDPTSNDDNHSSIADSTGYYTILNVPITYDWPYDPPSLYFWNRYTGTAEYSGFYKEKWEHPGPVSPRWRFDNNIRIDWAVNRNNETTKSAEPDDFYDFPLDKKTSGPNSGGPDGLISGYVDLDLALYSSNADVWVQNTNYNACTDMEGYYLVWNHGVHATGPPGDWGTEIVDKAPWGIPDGNYALRARALWYESDVIGVRETYVPEIYPNTVSVHSETPNINFNLFRKAGGIEGRVLENTQDAIGNEVVEDQYGNPIDNGVTAPPNDKYLFIKDAKVTLGNPDNGIGLPHWQRYTADGGEYEFNNQSSKVLPLNEYWPSNTTTGFTHRVWMEKDSSYRKSTGLLAPLVWKTVMPLADTVLERWFGFIDGFVRDCDTNKPIVNADVNATKQRTNPNPSATNEIATYTYDATETPNINNTDLEGYYLVESSVSIPKVQTDETEYTVTVAKPKYPTKSLNNITVEFNEVNKNNDFTLCKELSNTGVILGIVYEDADTDGVYDPGEEIGGVDVEMPGLDKATVSTTATHTHTLGDYNFIFTDVPLLPGGGDARYWVKFTHPDHEMAYGLFTTNTYNAANYSNGGTEDDLSDDSGNHIPVCGLQTVPDGWIEGLLYAPGSPNERLTDRDDNAKVWIPGAYRQCPTDDAGYYIIGKLAPYMPVGSTYPAVQTLVATADGYKPEPQRNVPLNSDTPWNHTWRDFSMEVMSSMDSGIVQGVVFFDGGIAVGDVGDPPGAPYDLGICTGGNYDGPDPGNPFEPNGAYDVQGTGENTVTEGIRNATVTLNPTTTTDSYGYYILTDIDSEMTHTMEASADLFENAQHNVSVDSGWNTENFAMDAKTGSISGRIYEDFDQDDTYDAPNEAIENATVRAWISATPSFSVSVYTETDGSYLMPLVPVPIATGSYTVHAEQVSTTPRYEPNQVDNVNVDPGVTTPGVDITLMREHGTVNGQVTYGGGTPLYGATVKFYFHWYSQYIEIFTTTTDANGDYSFSTEDTVTINNELDPGEDVDMDGMLDELWEGHWTIEVSHPAFQSQTKDLVVQSPYTVDFDLSGDLKPQTALIEGTVEDSTSTEIKDVLVTADRGDIQVQTMTGITGTNGHYEMYVPWGLYNSVTAQKAGYPTATQGPFDVHDYGAATGDFDDYDLDGEFDDLELDFTLENIVVLISPMNGGSVTTETPTLDWYDFAGATTYTLEISTSNSVDGSGYFTSTVDTYTGNASEYTVPSGKLTNGQTYHWHVIADSDTTTWSDIWSFDVQVGTSPTLLSPPNNGYASSTTPTFLWTTAPAASGDYQIQVATTNSFGPGDIVFDHTTGTNTQYTTQPGEALIDGNTYYWRVRRGTGAYPWSDIWSFTVDTSTGSIDGTVESGGSPLVGATVVAYYYDSNDKVIEAAKTNTTVGGYYILSGLDPSYNPYDVACYMEDYKAEAKEGVTVNAGGTITEDFDLEAGTHYDITLQSGWNLVSFPLVIDETVPVPALLNSIEGDYEKLAQWNANSDVFEYYYVNPTATDPNEFVKCKQFKGYWIKTTSSTTLRISGVQDNTQKSMQLKKGWNLIGYVFTVNKNSVTKLSPVSKVAYGWRLDTTPSPDQWYFLDPNNNYPTYTDNPKDNTLRPGYGYWIYATEDFTLTIQ